MAHPHPYELPTAHGEPRRHLCKMASQAYDRALQLTAANLSIQTKLAMIQDLFSGNGRSKPGPRRGDQPAHRSRSNRPAPVAVAKPVVHQPRPRGR